MSAETQELSLFSEMNYLDPKESVFAVTTGGVLTLQVKDQYYNKVDLYLAFPFSLRNRFISVRGEKDEEIGIIKELEEFAPASRQAIEQELEWRYYAPRIDKIISVKEEFGHLYWDVETDRGLRKFVTRGRDDGIRQLDEGRIMITDMTGNRFDIIDYRTLDAKSIRIIDTHI